MPSSNVAVTHATTGVVRAEVARRERVTPHMVRVTLTGPDLDRFGFRGFDQWFRLAIPVGDAARFDNLPDRYDTRGYLRYLTLPRTTRPAIRNYTVRAFRPDERELDVDFVSHGDAGVAGPWAAAVQPGTEVAFIDQGCGWAPVPADRYLLVADESGLPAVAGILRDLPADAVGDAVVELPHLEDAQHLVAPPGVTVHWLPRAGGDRVGDRALATLRDLEAPADGTYAFAVGESALATGARRHLVRERGLPKEAVTFCGYWKQGR